MSESTKKDVIIYTDGGAKGNPGPGGYGTVLLYGDHRKELSAGYRLTTNNRMELMAAIVALESLKSPCRVTLHSDSKYVVDAIEKNWVGAWRKKGWRLSTGKPAKNVDLWKRLLAAIEPHDVRFRWVKGHADIKENERCDTLAVAAADGEELAIDEVYEEIANGG